MKRSFQHIADSLSIESGQNSELNCLSDSEKKDRIQHWGVINFQNWDEIIFLMGSLRITN